jgi:hypothetical protein
MEYRNAKSLGDDRVALEINHPTEGWLPFTLTPEDTTPVAVFLREALDPAEIAPYAPPSIEIARTRALTALANTRWQRETGGIEVGGMAVRTDDKTQGRLTAAQSAFDKGLITSVDWKLGDQAWVTLAEAQLDQIVAAVTAHVAACFAAEKVVSDQITAAPDVDALAAIDLTAAFEAAYQAEMAP